MLNLSGLGAPKGKRKARTSRLQCPPREDGRRRDGGATAGELRDESRHHAPGPWRQKASRPSGKRYPSRGGVGKKALVGSRDQRGLQPFENLRANDPWGARKTIEEGSLYPPRHAASHAGRGEVLRSGFFGSRAALSSFQPAAAASDDWVDAPPASGVSKSGDLRGSNRAACLQRRAVGFVGSYVTHCPLSSKGGSLRKPRRFERGERGKRGRTRHSGPTSGRPLGAR